MFSSIGPSYAEGTLGWDQDTRLFFILFLLLVGLSPSGKEAESEHGGIYEALLLVVSAGLDAALSLKINILPTKR